MGEGAAEAIAASGRQGKVVIGSFDVQAPTVAALKEGKLAFTVSQSVYEQGYWSVAACVMALNGKRYRARFLLHSMSSAPLKRRSTMNRRKS